MILLSPFDDKKDITSFLIETLHIKNNLISYFHKSKF